MYLVIPSVEKVLLKRDVLVVMEAEEIEKVWSSVSSLIENAKRYYVLLTAVKISLFDHMRSPMCIDELEKRLSCRKEMLRSLCEALVGMGLLKKVKEDRYVDTEISGKYLLKDRAYSICDAILSLESDLLMWQKLPQAIFRGPVNLSKDEFFVKHVIHRMAVEAACGELQKSVEVIISIPEFANVRRMLDLGGGHGLYAVALAKEKPDLVAYVFDLPGVVGETLKYIKRFGVEDRVFTLTGNFFTDSIGNGYDMVFSSYNPGGKNPVVVKKIFESLNNGGIFVTKQSFRTSEREDDPLEDLWWNLWTINGVSKRRKRYSFDGDVPTVEDYMRLLEDIGFEVLRVEEFSDFDRMIISKKRGEM